MAGSISKGTFAGIDSVRKVLVQPGHAQFVREAGCIQDAAERISVPVSICADWAWLGIVSGMLRVQS